MWCIPHVHNTEDAVLVLHPANPCAEPVRQLCPWVCQLPARQQKAQGMGQCHEPMTFQPTCKATWQMRCLNPHFRFKEQHFHLPSSPKSDSPELGTAASSCCLSQWCKPLPNLLLILWESSCCQWSSAWRVMSAHVTQCEVPLDRPRGCWSYLIPYQSGSIIGELCPLPWALGRDKKSCVLMVSTAMAFLCAAAMRFWSSYVFCIQRDQNMSF